VKIGELRARYVINTTDITRGAFRSLVRRRASAVPVSAAGVDADGPDK